MGSFSVTYKDYEVLLSQFKKLLLGRLGDSVISLILYGSVARGKAYRESDIDLLIILKDASPVYYERLQPIVEIELELRESKHYKELKLKGFMSCFSTLILSQEEAKENRYIFLDMIEDAVILLDRGDFFKKRLKKLKERLHLLGARKVALKDGGWYWDLKPDLVAGEIFEL